MFYKIYNADNPLQTEKEWTDFEMLQHSYAMAQELIRIFKQEKESYLKQYLILNEFITKNDDLYDRYISFLKQMKTDPAWEGFEDEIEYNLFEFGADEESMNLIREEFQGAANN